MNAHASDLEVFQAVLGEHAAERVGEHPDRDVLVAYLTNELDTGTQAGVNDHLVACRACTATLLDLEPLARPDAGMPEGVANLAAAAAWRDLRGTLFTEAPPAFVAWPAIGRRWSTAVAASLLVATLGMSVWVARLSGTADDLRERMAELSQPERNAPVFIVSDGARSTDEETLAVPAEASRFLLIFTPGGIEEYAEYELRFFDPEGREVLHEDGLKLSESGGLRLLLLREHLPAAEYRVVVNGFDGERWRQVETYRRRIVEAAPGHG